MNKNGLCILGFVSLIGGSACTVNQIDAPYGAKIELPSTEIEIAWSETANDFDLSGMMFFFDVLVVSEDEMPLENIKVEVSSNYSGVYLVPQEAVELVSYPGLPPDIQSTDDVKDACSDEQGNYILAYDWCAWYWDTATQQFYQFSGMYANSFTYSDTGGYYWYAPTFMTGQTDGRGLLRVYSMIDMMPFDEDNGFSSVQILASIGVDSSSFEISTTE